MPGTKISPPLRRSAASRRCWVLLDQHYNAWLYKEGVLRTASDAYDATDLENVTAHLTNHCVQVRGAVQLAAKPDAALLTAPATLEAPLC